MVEIDALYIWVVISIPTGRLISAKWTQGEAQALADYLNKAVPTGDMARVELTTLEPLARPVDRYFGFRKYVQPNLLEAFLFFVSEVGELAGALVQQIKANWVRNNDHSQDKVEDEIGDALMMLVKTAQRQGVDPVAAMLKKWRVKGWKE